MAGRFKTVDGGNGRFTLASMDFTELVFAHSSGGKMTVQARRITGGTPSLGGLPPEAAESANTLITAIKQAFTRDESGQNGESTDGEIRESGTVRVLSHDGVRLKVRQVPTAGLPVYHCRRIRYPMPDFEALVGIPEPVTTAMTSIARGRDGGLMLVSGLPGAGKTTTMMAFLRASLAARNDLGAIVERQPEYMMNGQLEPSAGRIVQMRWDPEAEGTGRAQTASAIAETILAMAPRHVAIGQISSPGEARLALELAMAGVLTLASIQAADILSAISNLINRASVSMGREAARDAVAMCLRSCLHQSLGSLVTAGGDTTARRIKASWLFLQEPSTPGSGAGLIKADRLTELAGMQTRQEQRVELGQPPLEPRQGRSTR